MSRYPDIHVSNLLSNEELRSAIEALPDVFRAMLGDAIVTAVYGLGSNLHVDLWHLPMKVGTRWFDRFVQDSLRQEIVRPGDSDFGVTVGDQRLELVFCHEGHIHLGGTDYELQRALLAHAPFDQLRSGGSPSTSPDA
jgi:hypothetical protein